MRVIYFSRDYTPHDHRFLAALAESEHEVSYLRLEKRGRLQETRPLPTGVREIDWWGGDRPLHPLNWPRAAWEVRKVLNCEQPDLVHAGPIQSSAMLTAAAGFHPLLSMSWGSDLLQDANSGWGRWAARWTLERTDVFTGDCQTVRQRAIDLGAPAHQTFVFPWGVDLEHFRPAQDRSVRETMGWLGDEIVLLSTRSWEPLYGVLELAEAFIQVARDEPRLRLLMLGGGSLGSELVERFHLGGVADQVVMPGQIRFEELPDYYRAADLYVSASHSDGSSISLLEAMACGLPALVSDIPANREWVQEGENGWLFSVRDSDALAWALRQAFKRQDRFPEFGAASRAIAAERADWERNFQVLMQAYEAAARLGGHR
ncbi:MAG: glycosyltransferase family 4 protein [Anaerolineales bacterium]